MQIQSNMKPDAILSLSKIEKQKCRHEEGIKKKYKTRSEPMYEDFK